MDQSSQPTRGDILSQLQKRELHIPHAQHLDLEQLQLIYKGFIVPQPRRERREREMWQLGKRIQMVTMTGEKRPLAEDDNLDHGKRIKMDLSCWPR